MNIQDALQKLDFLRELVATTPIDLNKRGETVTVTISAGLAGLPEDGNDAAELFALADERLFQAKREGRNRVVASPEAVTA
jgi:diguanylate cyclase (GGDEF)-like protein